MMLSWPRFGIRDCHSNSSKNLACSSKMIQFYRLDRMQCDSFLLYDFKSSLRKQDAKSEKQDQKDTMKKITIVPCTPMDADTFFLDADVQDNELFPNHFFSIYSSLNVSSPLFRNIMFQWILYKPNISTRIGCENGTHQRITRGSETIRFFQDSSPNKNTIRLLPKKYNEESNHQNSNLAYDYCRKEALRIAL